MSRTSDEVAVSLVVGERRHRELDRGEEFGEAGRDPPRGVGEVLVVDVAPEGGEQFGDREFDSALRSMRIRVDGVKRGDRCMLGHQLAHQDLRFRPYERLDSFVKIHCF